MPRITIRRPWFRNAIRQFKDSTTEVIQDISVAFESLIKRVTEKKEASFEFKTKDVNINLHYGSVILDEVIPMDDNTFESINVENLPSDFVNKWDIESVSKMLYNEAKNIYESEIQNILFVGKTNMGKSSLIKLLTGDERIKVGKDWDSKTSEVGYHYYEDKYRFIDTPGLGDSNGKDQVFLNELIISLQDRCHNIHKVYFCQQIFDDKNDSLTQHAFKIIKLLFPNINNTQVGLIVTKCDEVAESKLQEKKLKWFNNPFKLDPLFVGDDDTKELLSDLEKLVNPYNTEFMRKMSQSMYTLRDNDSHIIFQQLKEKIINNQIKNLGSLKTENDRLKNENDRLKAQIEVLVLQRQLKETISQTESDQKKTFYRYFRVIEKDHLKIIRYVNEKDLIPSPSLTPDNLMRLDEISSPEFNFNTIEVVKSRQTDHE